MKEPVQRTNHPWLVGAAVVAIGGGFFYSMGSSDYPEPGTNLNYDITEYRDLDNIDTRFDELAALDPKMDEPRAMAVRDEFLFVAGKDTIAKFNGDDEEVARYEVEGTPNCLFVAEDGVMYGGFTDHVEVFDADGTRTAHWKPVNNRSYLTAIAAHEGNVFVADAGNRIVLRYDQNGELKTRIGAMDKKRDVPGIEVPSPYLDLAINDEGHLWVVNPGRLGLERYREDGDIVTSWYHPNLRLEGFSGCCNPTQIAFAPDGRLITGEKGLVRIKAYEVTMGKFEELIAGSRLFPKEHSVRDLAVDARGRILVIDPRSDTVRVFAMREDAQEESDGSETKPA